MAKRAQRSLFAVALLTKFLLLTFSGLWPLLVAAAGLGGLPSIENLEHWSVCCWLSQGAVAPALRTVSYVIHISVYVYKCVCVL